MANADMNRLMDRARIRLPGALDAGIQMEMFAALNEFLQNTNTWYEDLAVAVNPTTLSYLEDPAQYTYEAIPNQGSITRLLWMADSGGYRVPASMPILGELVVGFTVEAVENCTARVALTVTDPINRDGYPEFPDWILTKYGNEILDGVLGGMMSQIAKPYSSPAVAAMHLRKFRSGISKARVEAKRQNVYGAQTWSYPMTYATRNQR
jgi:hypothetical protein